MNIIKKYFFWRKFKKYRNGLLSEILHKDKLFVQKLAHDRMIYLTQLWELKDELETVKINLAETYVPHCLHEGKNSKLLVAMLDNEIIWKAIQDGIQLAKLRDK